MPLAPTNYWLQYDLGNIDTKSVHQIIYNTVATFQVLKGRNKSFYRLTQNDEKLNALVATRFLLTVSY